MQEQVEEAYLRSWDVLADALLRLDTSQLATVFAGEALATKELEVLDQLAAKSPVQLSAEHNHTISLVDSDTAVLVDRLINHSVLVDPVTLLPIEDDPNTTLLRAYTLMRLEDGWKVSRSVQQSP